MAEDDLLIVLSLIYKNSLSTSQNLDNLSSGNYSPKVPPFFNSNSCYLSFFDAVLTFLVMIFRNNGEDFSQTQTDVILFDLIIFL